MRGENQSLITELARPSVRAADKTIGRMAPAGARRGERRRLYSPDAEMPELESLFGTPHPVAWVTGSGAARVGNVIARTLAARGYHLVLHANSSVDAARQTVDELREAGCQATFVIGDVSDEDVVRRMVGQALEEMGRLDVLVNCASIWKPKPLEEVTAADVRRNFEVNTLGTFLCCQHAGATMVAQSSGGVIVNLGDWAVVRPYRNYAAYFPSKGAIPTLTRNLAVELAARNPRVRVNAILPGPVMLPADLPADERQEAINATLVKREGDPSNVAQAAVSLIENDFITGVCLPVDGGRSVFCG